MTRLLLVEDDFDIAGNLSAFLKDEGFLVEHVSTRTAGLRCIEENSYDLVLLDISLPDGSGYSVCAAAQAKEKTPVIFLTASGDEYSVVAGLDMGADDYIAKPFRPRELLSRIRSVLRRYQKESRALRCGELLVDVERALVTKGGQELVLTALEYRLLLIFLQNQGNVLPRNQLLEAIWDASGEYVNDNTLTVYIKRLREKIEEDSQNPVYLQTVRGLGYRMSRM